MSITEPVVLIVDDEPAVLRAVGRLLKSAGFESEAFGSPHAFLERQTPDLHGCVILDVSMPGLGGLELQQAMIDRGIDLPIVFLTGRSDVPMSVRAMKQGADDFLTKPIDDAVLLDAVRNAIAKDRVAWQSRLELAGIRNRFASLTLREREVLEHVIAGRLNKQTAAELGTVEKTIKVHRARIMEKMQVESLAELVRLAGRAGIVPAPPDLEATTPATRL